MSINEENMSEEMVQAVANAMVVIEDSGIAGELTGKKKVMYVPETIKDKKVLFNIMNNPEKRISEMINMTIRMQDIFAESVELVDQNTGELRSCPRIVIVDNKGVGYQCVSTGIFSALKKIFQVFGEPKTWGKDGLDIIVKQIVKGEKSILTINIA